MIRHIDDTLKRDLRQSTSFEPSSLLFATLGSAGNRLLEKSINRKVTQSLRFTYAWGCAFIKPFTMEVGLFLRSSMQAIFIVLTMD
jgi:hypothetical protein